MDQVAAQTDRPSTDMEFSPGIHVCVRTHVAQRKHNEDAFLVGLDTSVVVIADGVGGHNAGEVASRMTGEAIQEEMLRSGDLEQAVRFANQQVMAGVAAGVGQEGMASTVVAAHMEGPKFDIAWVGDSRTYLWDGSLHLLTRDHSFVAAQLEMGKITLEEARNHPRKNVIVQAIGLHKDGDLNVGRNSGALAPGETLLLCTDGLNDILENLQISAILSLKSSLAEKCEGLIQATLAAGGRDNVTVALLGADVSMISTGKGPSTVWSFDPETGKYEGLPELLDDTHLDQPIGTEMKKRPGTTEMMRIDVMDEVRLRSGEHLRPEIRQSNTVSWNWLVLAITAVGLVAAVAALLLL
ncbi:MAG: protein phosphatase [Alcanivorax sp.]|jgi:protein phosphatase